MVIYMSAAEYEMLCKIADWYGCTPAALGHDWIMREAILHYDALYIRAGRGKGMLGSGQDPVPSQASPSASASREEIGQ